MYKLKKNPDERKKNKFPGKEKELYILQKVYFSQIKKVWEFF